MKDSYITEVLALSLAGLSGVIIALFENLLLGLTIGTIILLLDSYFVVTKLKQQTVKEYLESK